MVLVWISQGRKSSERFNMHLGKRHVERCRKMWKNAGLGQGGVGKKKFVSDLCPVPGLERL